MEPKGVIQWLFYWLDIGWSLINLVIAIKPKSIGIQRAMMTRMVTCVLFYSALIDYMLAKRSLRRPWINKPLNYLQRWMFHFIRGRVIHVTLSNLFLYCSGILLVLMICYFKLWRSLCRFAVVSYIIDWYFNYIYET